MIRVEKRRKSPHQESPLSTENAFCVHCLQATVLMSGFPVGTPPEPLSYIALVPPPHLSLRGHPWPALDCSPTKATKDTWSLVIQLCLLRLKSRLHRSFLGKMPDVATLWTLPRLVSLCWKDIVGFSTQSPSRWRCLSTSISYFSMHDHISEAPVCIWFHKSCHQNRHIPSCLQLLTLPHSSSRLGQPLPKEDLPNPSRPRPEPVICPSSVVQYHLPIFSSELSMLLKWFRYLSAVPHRPH